jgi:hypothetical protein
VAAYHHGYTLRDSRPNHVAYSGAPQVVKQLAFEPGFLVAPFYARYGEYSLANAFLFCP